MSAWMRTIAKSRAFEKVKVAAAFLASFLYPLMGLVIWWCSSRTGASAYKKPAWLGMGLAFALFLFDYASFMLSLR